MSQKIALFCLKIKKMNALEFYLKVIKIKFSPIWYHSKVLIFKKTRLIYVIHIVQSCSLSAHKSFMDLKNTRHTDPPSWIACLQNPFLNLLSVKVCHILNLVAVKFCQFACSQISYILALQSLSSPENATPYSYSNTPYTNIWG